MQVKMVTRFSSKVVLPKIFLLFCLAFCGTPIYAAKGKSNAERLRPFLKSHQARFQQKNDLFQQKLQNEKIRCQIRDVNDFVTAVQQARQNDSDAFVAILDQMTLFCHFSVEENKGEVDRIRISAESRYGNKRQTSSLQATMGRYFRAHNAREKVDRRQAEMITATYLFPEGDSWCDAKVSVSYHLPDLPHNDLALVDADSFSYGNLQVEGILVVPAKSQDVAEQEGGKSGVSSSVSMSTASETQSPSASVTPQMAEAKEVTPKTRNQQSNSSHAFGERQNKEYSKGLDFNAWFLVPLIGAFILIIIAIIYKVT